MGVKSGSTAWWSRLGREGQFETLVKVGEIVDGTAKVTFLVPQGKGETPVLVERECYDLRQLWPFTVGDERIWDRGIAWGGDTPVKVLGVDEDSGRLICVHDGEVRAQVKPRYIKNANAAPQSQPKPQSQPQPQPQLDNRRKLEVLIDVVLALAKGEEPQPEDIDFLTGNLGKSPAYAVPARK
jgi:hypothetical protein